MSQTKQILEILKDCQPHSSVEIQERLFGSHKYGLFRLGARIFDLRSKYTITGWKDPKNPAIYWYQMQPLKTAESKPQTYQWNEGVEKAAKAVGKVFEEEGRFDCCPSYPIFKTHALNCEQRMKLKEKEKQGQLL